MINEKYIIEGMYCTACSSSIERVLNRIDAVEKANVNLIAKMLFITYDESKLSSLDILKTIEKAGFNASLYIENKKKESILKEIVEIKDKYKLPSLKTRLIISFIFLLPLMYISMYEMLNLPLPDSINKNNPLIYSFIQLILATPVLIVNRKFFINGFIGLKRLSPTMDTLVSLGSLISYLYGIISIIYIFYGHIDYVNNLYFDSSAMILSLITIGKALEDKAKNKATVDIDSLKNLFPNTVTILDELNNEKIVPYDDLKVNDNIIIKAGENIPVDGIIVKGSAYIDEQTLTGESVPVFKTINDKVLSPTVNLDGYLVIKIEKIKESTTLYKIIDSIREAGATKAKIERLADTISHYFVPIVMTISIITFILWIIISKDFNESLKHAIEVLVISCPCALGLATPVAIVSSISACAKDGILVKKAEAFEILNKVDTVIFDKTGTLTKGELKVSNIKIKENIDTSYIKDIIKTTEIKSNHPIAKALIEYTKDSNILESTDYSYIIGKGVSIRINNDDILIGNKELLIENNIDINLEYNSVFTLIYLSINKELISIIEIRDIIKEDSYNLIKKLKDKNIYVSMISGDSYNVVNKVKDELNIDVAYDSVLPQNKYRIIKEIKETNHVVAFIGDGINDSIALMESSIGIAINNGIELTMDSGDIILFKDNIDDVNKIIEISKRTVRIIKENLFWAFFYNIIMIPIAAGVFSKLGLDLNPMLASLSMSISSLIVVLNALRLKKIKYNKDGNINGNN